MSSSPTGRRGPGALRPVGGVLGVLLVVGGGTAALHDRRPAFEPAGTLPAATTADAPRPASPSTAATPTSGPTPTTGATPLGVLVDASFRPRRLRVAALGVDAPVVPVGTQGSGALTIPPDPADVGWWAAGAAPGSPVGTVVLAGHVDTAAAGRGALFELERAPVGARVRLTGPGGSATYEVQARRRYAKAQLPWRTLFAQTRSPRLVLVTCGGDFDPATGHYTDNVVVVATPV